LVFNPNWYISERIRLELGDDLDPSKGYIKMSSVYSSGEPRIAQLPGPSNPLGQVKFEFPNSYAVFVHDTPKKHLFKRARRAFSHGCIRLENALDFAGLLLQDDGNSAAEKIDRYTGRRRQVFVELNEPVPIVVEYVPVSSNASGSVVFCGDPYQRSRKALDQVPEILFTKPHHRGRGHGCDGSTSDV
jgi:murein L,D-transpeptidase YcbB/YkuD